jgi:hypothetical protein
MPRALAFRDVRGRAVPLARLPLITSSQVDGLGFLKAKSLRKFWGKYRKPIIGGALAAGAIVGAAYTGGATLTALPSILGKVAKGAGSVVSAAGGPEAVLSAAGSLVGGRGAGEASAEVSAPAAALITPAGPTPVRFDSASLSGGLGSVPMPLLIGGSVALLALVMLMNQRAASPSFIEVRRP